jgi:hypothetical protein
VLKNKGKATRSGSGGSGVLYGNKSSSGGSGVLYGSKNSSRARVNYKRFRADSARVVKQKNAFSFVNFFIFLEVAFLAFCVIYVMYSGREDNASKQTDIATAEKLGIAIEDGISSDDGLAKYIDRNSKLITYENATDENAYRVIGIMQATEEVPSYYYLCMPVNNSTYDNMGNSAMRTILKNLNESEDLRMQFSQDVFMNQWIFCVDKEGQVYVFAGGGAGFETKYVTKSHNLSAGSKNKVYEVWPEVDKQYKMLISDDLLGWKY